MSCEACPRCARAAPVAERVAEAERELDEQLGVERGVGAGVFDIEQQLVAGIATRERLAADDAVDSVVGGEGAVGAERLREPCGTGLTQRVRVGGNRDTGRLAGGEVDQVRSGDAGYGSGFPFGISEWTMEESSSS